MANPVIHFEIGGRDAPALQEFYRNLFEWEIDAENPMDYAFVNTGEGGLNGGIHQPAEQPPYITVYVQVDDVQAYLDKAEALGGKTVLPLTSIPDVGQMAWLQDPEGNKIGLWRS